MRNIIIIVLLLTGCTKANSSYIVEQPGVDMGTVASGQSDMTPATVDMVQVSADMANADMVANVQPDMAEQPDAGQGPDMITPSDMAGMYTHHDTFCTDTWTDTSPTVNNQLSATAAAACKACCETVTGAACNSCTDNSNISVGGYAGTVSFMSFDYAGYKYWFYYYDSNYELKAGKGEQYLTGVGLINATWWSQ